MYFYECREKHGSDYSAEIAVDEEGAIFLYTLLPHNK